MSLNGGSSVISIFILIFISTSTGHLPPTRGGFPLSQFSNCLFTLPVSGLQGLFVGRRGRDSTTDSFCVSVTGDELSVRSALALALTAASRNPRKVSGEPLSQFSSVQFSSVELSCDDSDFCPSSMSWCRLINELCCNL